MSPKQKQTTWREAKLSLEDTINKIQMVNDMYIAKAERISGKPYHSKPQLSKQDSYDLCQISNFVEALESAIIYLKRENRRCTLVRTWRGE